MLRATARPESQRIVPTHPPWFRRLTDMPILLLSTLDLTNKRVLIREDFNVPLQDGVITDDTRIRASLPGIKQALSKKARLLLVSHLGRPTEGQFDEKESLAPVAKRLGVSLRRVDLAIDRKP